MINTNSDQIGPCTGLMNTIYVNRPVKDPMRDFDPKIVSLPMYSNREKR